MAHVWSIHDSWVLLFNMFFNLTLKLCLYCKEIIPFLLFFFVFDPVFLLFYYLFLLISWTIIFVQDFEQLISDDIV